MITGYSFQVTHSTCTYPRLSVQDVALVLAPAHHHLLHWNPAELVGHLSPDHLDVVLNMVECVVEHNLHLYNHTVITNYMTILRDTLNG